MGSLFLGRTDVVVRGALDGLAARHRVYAANIANVDTPGYVPSDLPFEAQLREIRNEIALDPASVGQAPRLDLTPQLESPETTRVDGNGVQVDREVVRMAENSLTYDSLIQASRLRGEMLRSVISEGRR